MTAGLQPSLLRAMADALPISDELVVLLIASRRSDTLCTCKAFPPCGAWCGSEALMTEKTTSCSTYTGTVFQACVCACVNANYYES